MKDPPASLQFRNGVFVDGPEMRRTTVGGPILGRKGGAERAASIGRVLGMPRRDPVTVGQFVLRVEIACQVVASFSGNREVMLKKTEYDSAGTCVTVEGMCDPVVPVTDNLKIKWMPLITVVLGVLDRWGSRSTYGSFTSNVFFSSCSFLQRLVVLEPLMKRHIDLLKTDESRRTVSHSRCSYLFPGPRTKPGIRAPCRFHCDPTDPA